MLSFGDTPCLFSPKPTSERPRRSISASVGTTIVGIVAAGGGAGAGAGAGAGGGGCCPRPLPRPPLPRWWPLPPPLGVGALPAPPLPLPRPRAMTSRAIVVIGSGRATRRGVGQTLIRLKSLSCAMTSRSARKAAVLSTLSNCLMRFV